MRQLAILFTLLLLSSPVRCADDFLGTVVAVTDGDTFNLKTEDRNEIVAIRICGIDSPERSQPGYGAAAGTLAAMIEGKLVHCLQVGLGTPCDGRSRPTSGKRIVAQCFIGDKDIAMEMVRLRQACDWPRFSAGHYRIENNTCVREGN